MHSKRTGQAAGAAGAAGTAVPRQLHHLDGSVSLCGSCDLLINILAARCRSRDQHPLVLHCSRTRRTDDDDDDDEALVWSSAQDETFWRGLLAW
ncbi:unnamed protein product [Lampetra planeri]